MQLELKHIARILDCKTGNPANEIIIRQLLTDSRAVFDPAHTLFFALRTKTGDGHRYIKSLYDKGVRGFVVDTLPTDTTTMPGAVFLATDSVLGALHAVAKEARKHSSAKEIIAITGSRGKTMTKEMLYTLLYRNRDIARSPRSFNSQTGVPLSLWGTASAKDIAVIEAGISQSGEMTQLAQMIAPTTGVLTDLTESEHASGFESMDHKLKEKVSLFAGCRRVVYDIDSEYARKGAGYLPEPVKRIGFSTSGNENADIHFDLKPRLSSTDVTVTISGNRYSGTLNFTDNAQLKAACTAIATALALGEEPEYIAGRLTLLQPVNTRTEVLEGSGRSTIIHDRYPADITNLAGAVDFMIRRLTPVKSATIILGDLVQTGHDSSLDYKRLGQLLANSAIERVVAVGKKLAQYAPLWRGNVADTVFYKDTDTLSEAIASGAISFDNQLVLVSGTNDRDFSNITGLLEARRHETVLEVNLDAVVHNFNYFKAQLKPETGIVCMVKAGGYGAGSYELAKTLQSHGASYLAVAVLDEGVELRNAGITMPIMVLNPRVVNYSELFACRLEPEVFSFEELEAIASAAESHGITGYPVHIKLDTGMHRLGFVGEDIPALAEYLKKRPALSPRSVFSHLAAADDPSMDDYTEQQFALFEKWSSELQSHFSHRILRHILNSTGITRFPQMQYDMVRLGICLYGVNTMNDGSQEGLRNVSSLYTSIISLKHWPAGTTIGYNRKGVCHRDSVIATIPVGYADGIDRHLGNGAMKVLVNGVLCPSIGNICMDACMIDVTGCNGNVAVGDKVEIFGKNIPPAIIADTLGTIPYEILTSVSSRVKRVYYSE